MDTNILVYAHPDASQLVGVVLLVVAVRAGNHHRRNFKDVGDGPGRKRPAEDGNDPPRAVTEIAGDDRGTDVYGEAEDISGL